MAEAVKVVTAPLGPVASRVTGSPVMDTVGGALHVVTGFPLVGMVP